MNGQINPMPPLCETRPPSEQTLGSPDVFLKSESVNAHDSEVQNYAQWCKVCAQQGDNCGRSRVACHNIGVLGKLLARLTMDGAGARRRTSTREREENDPRSRTRPCRRPHCDLTASVALAKSIPRLASHAGAPAPGRAAARTT